MENDSEESGKRTNVEISAAELSAEDLSTPVSSPKKGKASSPSTPTSVSRTATDTSIEPREVRVRRLMRDNTILFTIGRMNPPTTGHMGLIKFCLLYTSPSPRD